MNVGLLVHVLPIDSGYAGIDADHHLKSFYVCFWTKDCEIEIVIFVVNSLCCRHCRRYCFDASHDYWMSGDSMEQQFLRLLLLLPNSFVTSRAAQCMRSVRSRSVTLKPQLFLLAVVAVAWRSPRSHKQTIQTHLPFGMYTQSRE